MQSDNSTIYLNKLPLKKQAFYIIIISYLFRRCMCWGIFFSLSINVCRLLLMVMTFYFIIKYTIFTFRRVYHVFEYFTFFFNAVYGFYVANRRLIYSMFSGALRIGRLDKLFLLKGFHNLDEGNAVSLQWRNNWHDGISNHQPHHCLLNRLFRRRSKKATKHRVTGRCAGNSPVTGEFPAQKGSNAENVSIWWRNRVGAELNSNISWKDMKMFYYPGIVHCVWKQTLFHIYTTTGSHTMILSCFLF